MAATRCPHPTTHGNGDGNRYLPPATQRPSLPVVLLGPAPTAAHPSKTRDGTPCDTHPAAAHATGAAGAGSVDDCCWTLATPGQSLTAADEELASWPGQQGTWPSTNAAAVTALLAAQAAQVNGLG